MYTPQGFSVSIESVFEVSVKYWQTRREVLAVNGVNFWVKGKIFLYEGKPAIKIRTDDLGFVEEIGDPPRGYFQNEFLKDSNRVYGQVDKQPEFPGGIAALTLYIKNNLKWPKGATNISGKVFVEFVVERDGSLSHPKALRGFDPAFYEEAVRVIKDGPKWFPGIENSKRVRVMYAVPVDFSIIE